MGMGFKGHADRARQLLAAGADPNARNGAGATVLMMAVTLGPLPLIRLLLEHGADPALTDPQGRTALDLVRGLGRADVAALLEDASGDSA